MSQAPILAATAINIAAAAARIRNGGIVAYPTETVYGLGVDPHNHNALQRVFAIKGRSPDRPVLLLIHDRADLNLLASGIPRMAIHLMDRFWPGPLTLILPAREGLSDYITSGSGTIAVRQASPGPAADLVRATGPITSTSANRSNHPPATASREAAGLLTEEDGLILEGHCDPDALPSTLVDTLGEHPTIIRHGAIPEAMILT